MNKEERSGYSTCGLAERWDHAMRIGPCIRHVMMSSRENDSCSPPFVRLSALETQQVALRGFDLVVPVGDRIGDFIRSQERVHERLLLRLLVRLIAADAVVADVGANIGNHTVFLATIARARVHAFEPNPSVFALLERNVGLNKLDSRVTTYQIAIGAWRGSASITWDEGHLGGAHLVEGKDIVVERLDNLWSGPLSLLKIDVEGGEVGVLQGAIHTIRAERPWLVIESTTKGERRSVRDILVPEGYRRVPVSLAGAPTYLYAPNTLKWLRAAVTPEVCYRLATRVPSWVRTWMAQRSEQ